MCVSGALVSLDRGQLVPMARKEMEDLRRLLSERLGLSWGRVHIHISC